MKGDAKVATARDAAAEARDRRAEGRDELAESRDVHAEALDQVAEVDSVRARAKTDRAHASSDRNAASADRQASADDRAAASFDDLTGAYRRGAGFVELEREVARSHRTGERLVLAFVDVDGLKSINDSSGHEAGDRVLRDVVAMLRTKLRSYDLIVRFGGDEFLCAVPGVSMDEAAERLATVNAYLAASPEHGSVTTGLADLQPHDSLQDIVVRADSELYRQRQRSSIIDLTAADPDPDDSN